MYRAGTLHFGYVGIAACAECASAGALSTVFGKGEDVGGGVDYAGTVLMVC